MKTMLLLTSVALLALTGASNAQIIYPADNGFALSGLTTFVVAPTGTAWTFSSSYADTEGNVNESGIAANGSQNVTGAPSGQAAFLQDVSSVSQSITLPTLANVSLTFNWEGRIPVPYTNSLGQNVVTSQDEVVVTLGGILLFEGTPTNTTSFDSITTAAANFAAGTYQLTFSGASSGVSTHVFTDNMSFIDNVQVNSESVPEPSTAGLMALGGVTLFALLRRLKNSNG